MAKKRPKTVSQQLRQAILDSGQSLCQIADACGVDNGMLSRFMRGERGLTTKTLNRVCAHLGLELRASKRKGR